jgi:hypothetical protein
MQHTHHAYKAIALLALCGSAACTPSTQPRVLAGGYEPMNVAEAFQSSNAMAFKPYTRTIFSTTDF